MSEESDQAGSVADAATDYETATARLDEIIARLDSGDAQLRETLDLCAEAKTLIEYCAGELAAVDEGLKELRLEDLAASLRPSAANSSQPAADSPEAPQQAVSPDDSKLTGDEQPPPPEEPPF
jgi:exodeoxyribonuclease VII small subunit